MVENKRTVPSAGYRGWVIGWVTVRVGAEMWFLHADVSAIGVQRFFCFLDSVCLNNSWVDVASTSVERMVGYLVIVGKKGLTRPTAVSGIQTSFPLP